MRAFRRGGFFSILVSLLLLAGLIAYGVTEEVALGSVSGRVLMVENGLPLEGATVILSPYADSDEAPQPRVIFTGEEGEFRLSNLPAGEYLIEGSGKAHSLKPIVIRVKEGDPTLVDLELQPHDPYLSILNSQTVFTPDEEPEFMLKGFSQESRAFFTVYKIRWSEVVREGGMQSALWAIAYGDGGRVGAEQIGDKVAEYEHVIQNRELEGTFTDAVKLPKLGEGLFFVRCRVGDLESRVALNISSIGLISKASPDQTLCFVTDLKTGKPMPGVQIEAFQDGVLKPIGTTGEDGTFSFQPVSDERALLLGRYGESRAVLNYYQPTSDQPGENERIFVYTDRPIYRPGDTIHFKGFVRKQDGAGYQLPASGDVALEFRDESGTLVDRKSVAMKPNGSFLGELSTSSEAAPGNYSVSFTSPNGEHVMPVSIAAYRKPEYTVEVLWDEPFYPMGSKAKARIKCEYYFGGPVVGAKVIAYVSRNPVWSDYYYEDYAYDEYYGGGEMVGEYEAVTNDKGEAVIEFDTELEGDPSVLETDFRYNLEASVADAGEKFFNGSGSVLVTRGAFSLKVETDKNVLSPGDSLSAKITASEHETDRPLANQQVRVVAGYEQWTRNESVFVPLESFDVVTGPDGTAEVTAKAPEGHSLVIRATAQDDARRTIKAEHWIWVYGGGFAGAQDSESTFKLTLDKEQYRDGDTAKALIATSRPGGSALITVEGKTLFWSKVVPLEAETTLVEIPVTSALLPQVTVSAAAVSDKRFLQDNDTLEMDLAPQKLNVTVAADQTKYEPGNRATYSIKTTDENGNGVPADVSLAVVDESIYAIREDDTDPVDAFYSDPGNRVNTSYSFAELYLDGGDKGGVVSLRTDFKDTAAWIPSVVTSSDGTATVTVDLPDNLTTWRATAIAVSDDTDAGKATGEVVVSKPLMVRLQGPRVMTQQDEQEISAVVTNDSGRDVRVNVSLTPSGFGVSGDLQQTVSLRNGQTLPVRWKVQALESGDRTLAARAWVQGGPSDGVEQRIEVLPHGRSADYRTSGEIRVSDKAFVAVRPDADPNTGRLTITLSPTIAATLFQSLEDLIGYPYGCTEQTMSRFLPTVLVDQLLKQTGIPAPDLSRPIPAMVGDGLSRLAKMQHYDGGWGWWEYDDSDPWMTAYVLHGLKLAQEAGYEVSPFMQDRALGWIIDRPVDSAMVRGEEFDYAYLAYVLALYEKDADSKKILNLLNTEDPPFHVAAYLAMAQQELGESNEAQRLLRRVKDAANEAGSIASWPEKGGDLWDVEPTALALLAMEKIDPAGELNTRAVRYLMLQRQGDGWWSTRGTAYSLIALTNYLRRTGEATAPSTVELTLNGTPLQRVRLDPSDLRSMQPTVTVPIGELNKGQNVLEFKVIGAPIAYYSLDLRQVAVADRLGRLLTGSGFTVERNYYLLKPQRMEDGTMRLTRSKKPVTKVRSGDLVRCVVTVRSDKERQYVMLEDFTPSNCRVTEREYPDIGESWDWWWARTVIRDDRVSFFARELPQGTHEFSYTMRAEAPGVSRALPPVAGNMYDPSDRASDAETHFEVVR